MGSFRKMNFASILGHLQAARIEASWTRRISILLHFTNCTLLEDWVRRLPKRLLLSENENDSQVLRTHWSALIRARKAKRRRSYVRCTLTAQLKKRFCSGCKENLRQTLSIWCCAGALNRHVWAADAPTCVCFLVFPALTCYIYYFIALFRIDLERSPYCIILM